jgi:outer membrane lipoprotein-sorting protein
VCVAAGLLLGVLAGCGAAPIRPPADALTSAAPLWQAIDARDDQAVTARIRASVEVFSADGRARVRQVLLVGGPGRFRIETLSPVDTTLSVIACDGERLIYYDVDGGRFYAGAPTAQNLARVARLPLDPTDLTRLLLGGPPVDPSTQAAADWALAWDEQLGAYRLRRTEPDAGRLDVWVRHASWTTVAARLTDAAGGRRLELTSADVRPVESDGVRIDVARRLRIVMPHEQVDLSIEVDRYDLNPNLPPTLFSIAPPRGITVESLDASRSVPP